MKTHHINMVRLANAQKTGVAFVGAISDLSVTAFDDTTITLTWTTPTADNALNYFEVYLDGVFYENTTDATVGWVITGLTAGNYYAITLKTVDVLGNKSAFSNEVTQLTSGGVPLVNLTNYWKLLADANDSVGVKNGTPTAITYVAGGIVGNAASFNGTTSKILIPSNTLPSGEFTVSIWAKLDTTSAEQRAFAFNNNTGSAYTSIRFNGGAANRIGILVYDGVDATVKDIDGYTLTTWTNIIVAAKSSVNYKTYVNGVLENTDSTFGAFAQVASLGNYFGTARNASGQFTDGLLCEYAIFDKQVNDAEALAIYNKGLAGQHLI